ncbi:hypothetical protein D3C85_1648550 [compost metagenome]
MRALFGKQGHRLLAVFGGEHLMPLFTHDSGEQQTVCRAIFGDQYSERFEIMGWLAQLMSNSLSKLEMARIFRTSELVLTTRISESSPPT